MGNILYYLIITGFVGLAYSFWKSFQVNGLEPGSSKASEVTATIKKGTLTYIQTEYKFLLLFVLSVGVLIFFKAKTETASNEMIIVSFLSGAILSALAGYLQTQVALKTNEKISVQSQNSYSSAFSKTFYGSTSIGLIGVSLAVIGLSGLLVVYNTLGKDWETNTIMNIIAGFALGASSIALFARMGGGIFAKSAELSESYLVKNEPGIKDKSLYNASSVANDAGQNILNVAGTGAELYESLSIALIASMLLGVSFLNSSAITEHLAFAPVLVPLIITAIGILTSIGASFLLRANNADSSKKAIEISEIFSSIVLALASFFVIKYLFPAEWETENKTTNELIITTYKSLGIFWSVFFGIAASAAIGRITNIFVGSKSKSVKSIVDKSFSGPAGNISAGFEQSYLSTGLPILIVFAICVASYYFAGFYGIGMAAIGLISNIALQNAINAFAPIADNSNSIAIKSGMNEQSVNTTNDLKVVGLQTNSRAKGYLTVAATTSVIALLCAFIQQSGLVSVDLTLSVVLAGIVIGAALPFVLSSNMLTVVRTVSTKMINEVKRQFAEIPALTSAKEILDKYNGDLTYATEGEKETVYAAHNQADYKQCIEVGTYATIWGTLIPSIIIMAVPALVGYFLGAEVLYSLLVGVVSGSLIMAVFQATIGSAWETTKLVFETGAEYKGEIYSKESAAYQAALVGEKVGKPLKDTASPAVLILMKAMLVVAIILAPTLADRASKKEGKHVNLEKHKTIKELDKGSKTTLDLNIE